MGETGRGIKRGRDGETEGVRARQRKRVDGRREAEKGGDGRREAEKGGTEGRRDGGTEGGSD